MATVRGAEPANAFVAIVTCVSLFRTRKNVNGPVASPTSVHVIVAFNPEVMLEGREICIASVASGAATVRKAKNIANKEVTCIFYE
jgi:hypothetical protein